MVLKLNGAEEGHVQLKETPTINHFFTKVNLDLD
jgi:hypothetical protein